MKLRRKGINLALVSALALALSNTSQAAGDADKRASATPPASATQVNAAKGTANVHQVRASELIGKNVVNPKGEGLGEIKDLVVDTTSGKVHYAVISFGGFLGLGDKLFAYPLEKFERTTERGKLVLNVDKERMKTAPGFEDKNWPNFGTAAYRGEVDKFYGTNTAQGNPRFVRATQILKGDVKDRSNKDVGDIEDMVVSLPTGRVSYVVLEFDRAWTPDDKLVAMPMKALRSEDGDGTDLVYQSNRESLKGAPSFEKNQWPDLVDGRFTSDVNRYEQNWRASPSPMNRAADNAERSVDRAAGKTERAVERAVDKTERAVDRATAPVKN